MCWIILSTNTAFLDRSCHGQALGMNLPLPLWTCLKVPHGEVETWGWKVAHADSWGALLRQPMSLCGLTCFVHVSASACVCVRTRVHVHVCVLLSHVSLAA
jgi:hypothetical protein